MSEGGKSLPRTRNQQLAEVVAVRGRRVRAAEFLRSPQAVIGGVLLVLVVGFGLLGPLLTKDPITQDLGARLHPPMWAGGSADHPFGTDLLGRDVLARLASGVRVSLMVVLASLVASAVLGTVIGLIAGYFQGPFDVVAMRLADIQLAFPEILLILLVVGTVGPGTGTLIAVLTITGWVLYARLVRSQVLAIKHKEYIDALRALGAGPVRTIARHVFPNLTAQLTVIASFATANIVLIEAALSFLGLGVPPPTPSLGGMIADGQAYLVSNPWLCVIPGVAILLMVVGVNLLGEFLRHILNPRTSGQAR